MMTNFIAFYNKMTTLDVEGRAVDVLCLHFSMASDRVPCSILTAKLVKYRQDKKTVRWT